MEWVVDVSIGKEDVWMWGRRDNGRKKGGLSFIPVLDYGLSRKTRHTRILLHPVALRNMLGLAFTVWDRACLFFLLRLSADPA
jgi:hypothetical protein